MNRLFAVLLVVFVCLFCTRVANAQRTASKLHGEWRLDVPKTTEELTEARIPDKAKIFSTIKDISLTFKPDGVVQSQLKLLSKDSERVRKAQGKWKTIVERKDYMEVELKFKDKPQKVVIEFLGKNLFRITYVNRKASIPILILKNGQK